MPRRGRDLLRVAPRRLLVQQHRERVRGAVRVVALGEGGDGLLPQPVAHLAKWRGRWGGKAKGGGAARYEGVARGMVGGVSLTRLRAVRRHSSGVLVIIMPREAADESKVCARPSARR